MKDRIHTAFEEITMPAACEANVKKALSKGKGISPSKLNYLRIAAAAACLLALVLVVGNPTVVRALEEMFTSDLQKEVIEENTKITVTYRSPDGKFTSSSTFDGNIELAGHGRNNLTVTPEWYVEQDDRVYFAGNGEFIDVTDLIDLDTPFTYIYTDQGGIIHYICIGGVYDTDPDKSNVGYAEWYYDPNYVDVHGIEGHWVGGYCDNYWDKDTDTDWPWLKKAKEEMGIPWGSFVSSESNESE